MGPVADSDTRFPKGWKPTLANPVHPCVRFYLLVQRDVDAQDLWGQVLPRLSKPDRLRVFDYLVLHVQKYDGGRRPHHRQDQRDIEQEISVLEADLVKLRDKIVGVKVRTRLPTDTTFFASACGSEPMVAGLAGIIGEYGRAGQRLMKRRAELEALKRLTGRDRGKTQDLWLLYLVREILNRKTGMFRSVTSKEFQALLRAAYTVMGQDAPISDADYGKGDNLFLQLRRYAKRNPAMVEAINRTIDTELHLPPKP